MAKDQPNQSAAVADRTAINVESDGVENLIGRLRNQGIEQGRTEADALIAAAKQEAADILAAARRQADVMRAEASEEAAKLKTAGEDAIRLAMRDTILTLEGDLLKEFANRLRNLVKGALADPAFLQRLILEVAGKAGSQVKKAEILLPSDLVSLEDLQKIPEKAEPGTLMHFVLSMGGGMLREGMHFGVSDDGEAGIKVCLVDEDVRIDLTESAVGQLLMKHLLPRFRALLRGAVVTDHADPKNAGRSERK